MNPETFTRFVYWLTIVFWILIGMFICSGLAWGVMAFIDWIIDIIIEGRDKHG